MKLTLKQFLNEGLLLEDFGNLNAFSKHFLKTLDIKDSLRLGANSPISHIPFKNQKTLSTAIKDENNYIVQVSANDVGIFFFTKNGKSHYKKGAEIKSYWYTPGILDISNDEHPTKSLFAQFRFNFNDVASTQNNWGYSASYMTNVPELVKNVFAIIETLDPSTKYSITVAGIDTKRKETRVTRQDQKQVYAGRQNYSFFSNFEKKPFGFFPEELPGSKAKNSDAEKKRYYDAAKNDLAFRLNKFKLEKIDNINDIEELIEYLKNNAMPEQLKVKGHTYTMGQLENFSLQNFATRTPVDKRNTPKIRYDVDRDTPEWEAYRKKLKHLRELYDLDDEQDKIHYEEAQKKFAVPNQIFLTFKIGPGGIIISGGEFN